MPHSPFSQPLSDDLVAFRHALLSLHKAILEFERKRYEANHGRIATPGDYFNLVTSHPAFTWLRPLSTLIVTVDEAIETDPSEGTQDTKPLFLLVSTLLSPQEEGTDFAKKYHSAIQSSPEVAHAHGEVMRELKKLHAS